MANGELLSIKDVVKVLNSNPKYDYSYALNQPSLNLGKLLISRMLTGPLRDYVIKDIKKPLMKTLVVTMRRFVKAFGNVRKEDTILHNTHILLNKRDKFSEHYSNSDRMELMQAGWELLLSEYEHDSHYRWLFDWLIKEIHNEINKGNWVLNDEEFPDKRCWKENDI